MQSKNQDGFSLVEMLIALVGMLIVLGGAFMLMKDSIKFANTTYEVTEAQESVRVAHEIINRDLVGVGDGLTSLNNIRLRLSFVTNYLASQAFTDPNDPTTAIMGLVTSDNDVAPNRLVLNTNPAVYVRSSPYSTDRITFLQIDRSFSPITLPSNAIVPSGSNVSVSEADIGKFSVGEFYFITSSIGSAFGVITEINTNSRNLIFADSDIFDINQPGDGGPINVITDKGTLATSLARMQIVHYFVGSNGLLIRRVFGVKGGAFSDSVIAEHVVNLQFRYSLSLRDANGNIVQPVAQISSTQQQPAVTMVEAQITIETTRAIHNGSRQQITMTGATGVRNMQFGRALSP